MIILFIVPWDEAGIRSGRAWLMAASSTSVIRWEVSTLPPATPRWGRGSTRLPASVITRTGRRQPWLAGASSPTTHRTTYRLADTVTARGALMQPGRCGAVPVKSMVIPSPATVTATLTATAPRSARRRPYNR